METIIERENPYSEEDLDRVCMAAIEKALFRPRSKKAERERRVKMEKTNG